MSANRTAGPVILNLQSGHAFVPKPARRRKNGETNDEKAESVGGGDVNEVG